MGKISHGSSPTDLCRPRRCSCPRHGSPSRRCCCRSVLAVSDLVLLDAGVVVRTLEVGEDIGADLGSVGAQRVVVLVAAFAAVVHAIAHQEVRDALQLGSQRSMLFHSKLTY